MRQSHCKFCRIESILYLKLMNMFNFEKLNIIMRVKIFILLIVIFSGNFILSQNKKGEIINYLKKEMEEKKFQAVSWSSLKIIRFYYPKRLELLPYHFQYL